MKKIELLAPAGSLEKLKIACLYGADAVFIGGIEHGLRSNSQNFSIQEIIEGVEFANEYGVDIYVTTNIYAHQENVDTFKEYVLELKNTGVKGLIISDPAYISIAKEFAPNLELHISTQQSITNTKAANFYESLGADRVVLARELTFDEIEEVSKNTNCEIEVFLHGAVCSSYSGRCTISNYMTGRDSNRGGCVQSCRWEFDLTNEKCGKVQTINNKDDHKFSMSAKDMQLLDYIPKMCSIGIDSLKVEGRMKSFHYVATVINVYRQAIDSYFNDPENYEVKESWRSEIEKAEARPSHAGSLIGDLSDKDQIFNEQYQSKKFEYCGYVLGYNPDTNLCLIEQRNHFKVGDIIEFFGPNKNKFSQKVDIIYNVEMELIEKANHPLMHVYITPDQPIDKDWLVRKIN